MTASLSDPGLDPGLDPSRDSVPPKLIRRSLLGYAASTPVLAASAGLAIAPSTAVAAPLPLTPPDSVDNYDVGDSIVQASAPTMPLVKLSLSADGVYTFEMPRLSARCGRRDAGVPG